MGNEFTVYKGSASGTIVEAKCHRDLKATEAFVEISHCGVCGTDQHYLHADQGLGHEGVGIIKEIGAAVPSVSELKVGDRVGMGWFQKVCGYCKSCLTGIDAYCLNSEQFGMANLDQGCFGTGVAWDVSTLYKIPDAIASEDAGPLMCGGATVWGPLYQHGLKPGSRVGVVGIGGLGHLAIQFASKMGMEVVVFSSTDSKKEEAMKFGASEFVATKGLTKFEGIEPIDMLLITTSAQPDYALYQTVMAKYGKIFPLTISFAAEPIPMLPMVVGGLGLIGSAGAHRQSIKEMLKFAARTGVKPKIQEFPMSKDGITEALRVLDSGKMRYRGVVVV